MRYLFPLFVVLLCLVGVATATEENTSTVTYKVGDHNISFQLNNSDEYKTIIEPPAYSSESKSWTYHINITQSANNYITFNIHEYTESQDMDISKERKLVASGFDFISMGGYKFSDITINGHPGYTLYYPEQKVLPYTKNERIMPETYGASFWQDDKTSVNLGVSGLGETVFNRIINSLKIESAA